MCAAFSFAINAFAKNFISSPLEDGGERLAAGFEMASSEICGEVDRCFAFEVFNDIVIYFYICRNYVLIFTDNLLSSVVAYTAVK